MARPLRIEYPGAVYHITSRGNARQTIFEHFMDKKQFLSILEQVIVRYQWICHAYCLMDNHYHLLIETVEPNLSAGMRQLNGTYTQFFNRKINRVGHLFQGRFKSILVEKKRYLLELARYIVLNPVRAHIVKQPYQFTWSSYMATAGLLRCPDYLTTSWILQHFDKDNYHIAQHKYRSFINEGINKASPLEELKAQILLGSEEFVTSLKSIFLDKEKVSEIPKHQRKLCRPSLNELFDKTTQQSKPKRNETIRIAIFEYGYTQSELSNFLGLHYSTVSRLLKAEMSKLKT